MTLIDAIAVIVPARDEEELLPRCLAALEGAVEAVGDTAEPPEVTVVVVLDSCTDSSLAIAARWPHYHRVAITAGAVGTARRVGVRRALTGIRHPASRVWLATTDADSAVPENWLTTQLAFARTGSELVLGTVQPDADLPGHDPASGGAPGDAHGHPFIYGANLGVRADRYLRAGEFSEADGDEDVLLVAALRRLGIAPVRTSRNPVLTSARLHGRAPHGYAGYLREHYGAGKPA
ncbi:glycosyltransferase [Glaciibacter sp. 2TAF33]|uniref:glycosyltransferase n=1 Tax=Glaciibacter sp. 2TAF33 TaxID=3233015 RepID=UPI003F8F7E64